MAQTAVSSLSPLESGTKFRMPWCILLDRVVNVSEAQNVLAVCLLGEERHIQGKARHGCANQAKRSTRIWRDLHICPCYITAVEGSESTRSYHHLLCLLLAGGKYVVAIVAMLWSWDFGLRRCDIMLFSSLITNQPNYMASHSGRLQS